MCFLAFDFLLAFSFSVLVLREANKSPTHRILVGNQREKTTLGHGFLSFFFVLLVNFKVYMGCRLKMWDKEA